MSDGLDLRLSPALDPRALAPVFARFGRLHLPDVFPGATAERLRERLLAETRWNRSTTSGGKSLVLPVEGFDAQPPEWRAEFDAAVRAGAASGFQYLFDAFAVSDEVEAGRREGLVAEAVYDVLNGPEFLGFVKALTGDPRCAYVDAQVTRFGPGQFLTTHNDGVEGKNRLFAYVLNLTPRWRPDWGGLLAFLDEDGHVAEAYTPAMNALNLFRVPQPHLVTEVASFAPAQRLSVTGWIRSRPD